MDKDINLLPTTDEQPSDERPTEVSRRNILVGTAAAVAATGLAIDPALALHKKHAAKKMIPGAKPHGAMGGMADMEAPPGELPHLASSKKWFQPFMEPSVISSTRAGVLSQELTVGFTDVTITTFDANGNPIPRTQCVRCYNGSVPGTTFRIMPGDRLELAVYNNLPPNQPAPPPGQSLNCDQLMDRNFPGCFNTTNVHFHGLHVSPKSNAEVSSDDVSIHIVPKGDSMSPCMPMDHCYIGSRKYCLQLPTFHAPGTHWYHAHVHGSTGIQVSNGVAGVFVIEEPEDQRIKNTDGSAIPEKIWMIQEVIGDPATSPTACTDSPGKLYMSGSSVYSNMYASKPSTGNVPPQPYGSGSPRKYIGFTVNSLSGSTLKMAPNEIQRWRIIDATATPRGIFNFVLLQPIVQGGKITGYKDFSNYMYLIAVDGITFYGHKPQQLPVSSDTYPVDPNTNANGANPSPGGWALSPGNRADVLVSLPAGQYQVWRYDNSHTGGGPVCQVLANIDVGGTPVQNGSPGAIALPGWDKAPCYLQPIMDDEINAPDLSYDFHVDQAQFQVNGVNKKGSYFGGFMINGKVYGNPDGTHPNTTVKLGDVRKTRLVNSAGGNHPYHIHVNPFQVEGDMIDPSLGNNPWNWRWWDTILVPEAQGSNPPVPVNTRSRYLNYDGAYVFHCHILIHEDAGMMQDFTVEADAANGYPGIEPCQKLEKCQMGRGWKGKTTS